MMAFWLIGLTVAAANIAPPVAATRLDGSGVSGLWAAEQQAGKITLSVGGRDESIAIDDLLCLEFGATRQPGPSSSARLSEVFLAHGGRLWGRLEEGNGAGNGTSQDEGCGDGWDAYSWNGGCSPIFF